MFHNFDQNSMQMCCFVFEFIFLPLEQHTSRALFLYECVKTTRFIIGCLFCVGRCRKHSSYREYHHCRCIIHLCSPVFIQKYRQLSDRDRRRSLDSNNTSRISCTIQGRELVPRSFHPF